MASVHRAVCTPGIIQRDLSKISGPLLDRIDIHIEVPAVPHKELGSSGASESSDEIRESLEHPHVVAIDSQAAVRKMGLPARP